MQAAFFISLIHKSLQNLNIFSSVSLKISIIIKIYLFAIDSCFMSGILIIYFLYYVTNTLIQIAR